MQKCDYHFTTSTREQAVKAISSITLSLGFDVMETSRSPFMCSINGHWGTGKSLWWDKIRESIPRHNFELLLGPTTQRICEVWVDNALSTQFICASLTCRQMKNLNCRDSKSEALKTLREFILAKSADHKFKAKRKIYIVSQGPLSGTDINIWFNTPKGEDWPDEQNWERTTTVRLTSDRVKSLSDVHRNLERLEAHI